MLEREKKRYCYAGTLEEAGRRCVPPELERLCGQQKERSNRKEKLPPARTERGI